MAFLLSLGIGRPYQKRTIFFYMQHLKTAIEFMYVLAWYGLITQRGIAAAFFMT